MASSFRVRPRRSNSKRAKGRFGIPLGVEILLCTWKPTETLRFSTATFEPLTFNGRSGLLCTEQEVRKPVRNAPRSCNCGPHACRLLLEWSFRRGSGPSQAVLDVERFSRHRAGAEIHEASL